MLEPAWLPAALGLDDAPAPTASAAPAKRGAVSGAESCCIAPEGSIKHTQGSCSVSLLKSARMPSTDADMHKEDEFDKSMLLSCCLGHIKQGVCSAAISRIAK
jgi:hypothetical protein